MAALRPMVPRPTPVGIQRFTTLRLAKEAELEQEREAYLAAKKQEEEAAQLRRMQAEAEARRRQAEEAEELLRSRGARRTGFARPQAVVSCWRTLGLPPTATKDEIKERYHKLAMEHHPDRGGDPDVFKKVQAAYEQAMGRTARPR